MGSGTGESTELARSMSFGSILAWSCGLGLGSGTLELLIFLLKCRVLDPRNVNVSRQMVWMFPMSGLIVVGAVGLILAVGSRLVPRLKAPRWVLFALANVAFVGVVFRAPIFTVGCLVLSSGLAWRVSTMLSARIETIERAVRPVQWLPVGLLALTIAASLGETPGTFDARSR